MAAAMRIGNVDVFAVDGTGKASKNGLGGESEKISLRIQPSVEHGKIKGLALYFEDGEKECFHEAKITQQSQWCRLSNNNMILNPAPGLEKLVQPILIRMSSVKDMTILDDWLAKVKSADKGCVFDERTEEASAVQYFQFYGYLSQQQNMMQDYVRTATYQKAMLTNTPDFQDKIILDVGAGSGILSFFAVQAGAKRVYAVEASSMAEQARKLVRANNLVDKIIIVAGKIEEVDIPEKVDVIISEPMGYMLYNERMLESYLHAKKFLKEHGMMFPTTADLHIAPFTDDALYMEQFNKANFWCQESFHNVNLTSLREPAVEEYFKQPIVDTFHVSICMARAVKHSCNFLDAIEEDLFRIEIPLKYTMLATGTIHGLAFWFDVAFVGSVCPIWLSTAPTEPLTHWYQVRCLLPTPLFVGVNQELVGKVVLHANKRQSYDVEMELGMKGQSPSHYSRNLLDLKNPIFRYTGQPVQPPPGGNQVSPSDAIWAGVPQQQANGVLDPNDLSQHQYTMNGGIPVDLNAAGVEIVHQQSAEAAMAAGAAMHSTFSPQHQMDIVLGAGQQAQMVGQPAGGSNVVCAQYSVGNQFSTNVSQALLIGDYAAAAAAAAAAASSSANSASAANNILLTS